MVTGSRTRDITIYDLTHEHYHALWLLMQTGDQSTVYHSTPFPQLLGQNGWPNSFWLPTL